MKKVFIGVLAALMLFAFTACENNAPQTPIMGNQIEGVELVSAPDYIIGIGDDIDPAEVKLNVIKNDGSKVSYTGTELNLKAPTTLSTINNCAVTYGNLTFYVNIPAYNWDEITAVDLSGATQKTIKTTDTWISTEGITVTVSYAKGTRSGVAIEEAITKHGDKITFSGNVASFGYKVGDEINIAEALMKEEVNETISALLDKATGSWVVTVDDSAKKITDVVLKQADDKEIFAVGATNKINGAAIEGTITYSDGTSADVFFNTTANGEERKSNAVLKEVSTTAVGKPLTGYYIVFTNITNDYSLSESEDSVEVSAYVVDSEGLESEVTKFDIAAIEDYPASAIATIIEVDDGNGGKKKPTLDWEDPIKSADYKFTITWASNYSYAEGKEPKLDGKWVPNPSKVLIETTNNTETGYPVTFTYDGYVGTADPDKEVETTGGKYYVKHAE